MARSPSQPGRVWSARLRGVIALDPRSLGVFRIGLGLALLANLALRAPHFTALYGERGVFPAALAARANPAWQLPLSPFFLEGGAALLWVWAVAAVLLALGVALGWRSRACLFGSWLLLVSMNARNPFAAGYEDRVLTLLCFWGLFLPLAGRFAWRRAPSDGAPVWSGASAALVVQIALLYLATGLHKTGAAWHEEGSAIAYALGQRYAARPWAEAALAAPGLLAWLSHLTLVWERGVWLLLLSPFATGPLRTLAILSAWGFHAGLGVFLALGLFPPVMILATTALLPSWFWERLGAARAAAPVRDDGHRAWIHVVPLLALAYVVVDNGIGLVERGAFPEGWRRAGRTLHLDQDWRMYAPEPERFDYYYVLPALRADGARVDLGRDGSPLLWQPPARPPWRPESRPWAVFLDHARVHHGDMDLSMAIGAWLCRHWNAAAGAQGRIRSIDWYVVRYEMDEARRKSRTRRLAGWDCPARDGEFIRRAPPRPEVWGLPAGGMVGPGRFELPTS